MSTIAATENTATVLEGSARDQAAATELKALAASFRASRFSAYSADAYSDAVAKADLSRRADEVADGLAMRIFFADPSVTSWSSSHLADKIDSAAARLERNKNWCSI